MKKYTKYYILIAIISAALGVGVGFLIKEHIKNKVEETETIEMNAPISE